jgi:DNA-binding NarL/FixJ family response regulator
MNNILIVDDHPLMREGIATALDSEMDLNVCAQADSAEDAIEMVGDEAPDLAIIDISLPGMNGVELIKEMQVLYPDVLLLVVSRHDEDLYAERVIRAGAKGYVMKQEGKAVIVKAVRRILDGGTFLSDNITDKFLMSMSSGSRDDPTQSPLDLLSDRELEVFELTGHGLGAQDIADRMNISPKTVQSYQTRIKNKLSLDSARELVRRAVQWVESE